MGRERFTFGPLIDLVATWKEEVESIADFHQIKAYDVGDRESMTAKRGIYSHQMDAIRRGRCMECWMMPEFCLCGKFTPAVIPHKLVVYYHFKEVYRSSNTGKVMLNTLNDVEYYIRGVNDSDWLKQLEETKPSNVLVLFPLKNHSITVSEYLEQLALKRATGSTPSSFSAPSEGDDKANKPVEPLTIIMLDGTWSNARLLAKGVPEFIPRVRVTPTERSLFRLRTQTQADRICTLEAFALLLQELQDLRPCEQETKAAEVLISNLKIHVDGGKAQSHRNVPFNTREPPRNIMPLNPQKKGKDFF
jgi:DTW domain-containing protein